MFDGKFRNVCTVWCRATLTQCLVNLSAKRGAQVQSLTKAGLYFSSKYISGVYLALLKWIPDNLWRKGTGHTTTYVITWNMWRPNTPASLALPVWVTKVYCCYCWVTRTVKVFSYCFISVKMLRVWKNIQLLTAVCDSTGNCYIQ